MRMITAFPNLSETPRPTQDLEGERQNFVLFSCSSDYSTSKAKASTPAALIAASIQLVTATEMSREPNQQIPTFL